MYFCSRIIVAMTIVPANEGDHKYFLKMIKQGVHNCSKDRIQTVIVDRGFLDRAQLWGLNIKWGSILLFRQK